MVFYSHFSFSPLCFFFSFFHGFCRQIYHPMNCRRKNQWEKNNTAYRGGWKGWRKTEEKKIKTGLNENYNRKDIPQTTTSTTANYAQTKVSFLLYRTPMCRTCIYIYMYAKCIPTFACILLVLVVENPLLLVPLLYLFSSCSLFFVSLVKFLFFRLHFCSATAPCFFPSLPTDLCRPLKGIPACIYSFLWLPLDCWRL